MSETEEQSTESSDEVNESEPQTTQSGGDDGGVDVGAYLSLNDAEKGTLADWALFLGGIFAAIGIAQGLNVLIQNQWAHTLVFTGPFYELKNTVVNPETLITLTLFALPLLGILLTYKVGHEEETPVKVAAVTSFVTIVVVTVVGGFLGVVTVGAVSIDLVNTLVSSLGAGIAGAVGTIIAVLVTQNFGPDGLGS